MTRSTRRLALTVLSSGLLLAACSSPAAANKATTTTSKKPVVTVPKLSTTTIPAPKAKYVVIDGKTIRVPTEFSTYPIQAASDTGHQIIIYQHSFVPKLLNAPDGTIVFTNLTTKTVEITFPDYPSPSTPLKSGPIAPGGTFQWHHDGNLAIDYTGTNGAKGYIDVHLIGSL